jgi:GNAT superfamily N-acetyltransferase
MKSTIYSIRENILAIVNADIEIPKLEVIDVTKEWQPIFNQTCLYIQNIYTPPNLRRQGIASKLLEEFCILLDSNNTIGMLEISPYEDGTISYGDLFKFYSKFEFELSDIDGLFVRYPQ